MPHVPGHEGMMSNPMGQEAPMGQPMQQPNTMGNREDAVLDMHLTPDVKQALQSKGIDHVSTLVNLCNLIFTECVQKIVPFSLLAFIVSVTPPVPLFNAYL